MLKPCHVHAGLAVAPGLLLLTREQPDGTWLAWIEQDGTPVLDSEGRPQAFSGTSCYRAQCEAARWLRRWGVMATPSCGECDGSSEEAAPAS